RDAFYFQAEDGIRYFHVTGVQTCALPISGHAFYESAEWQPASSHWCCWISRPRYHYCSLSHPKQYYFHDYIVIGKIVIKKGLHECRPFFVFNIFIASCVWHFHF